MKKHTFENEKMEDAMKICKILMVLEHFFFFLRIFGDVSIEMFSLTVGNEGLV